MQRPSNLIFAFIFAIASVFLVYATSRIFFRLLDPPETEIEVDDSAQIKIELLSM